jgi:hypothetical protein
VIWFLFAAGFRTVRWVGADGLQGLDGPDERDRWSTWRELERSVSGGFCWSLRIVRPNFTDDPPCPDGRSARRVQTVRVGLQLAGVSV